MRESAGASYYYTTDALGSVILLTDSSQGRVATYAYDSWEKPPTPHTATEIAELFGIALRSTAPSNEQH